MILAPALALLLAAGAPARPAAGAEAQRAAIAQELVKLGAALQAEIEAGDAEAVAARVPEDGLRCGERVLPRARVLRDLRGPGTWLNGVLFGDPGAPAPRGEPASLRAFFAEAKEVAVLVAFARDPAAGAVGRPCLDFRARGLVNPARPFCFEKRKGRWWLTQSLYPCG